ncbi:DUF1127 domain-containing protein [Primorskyibacter aestuariivivens]|uniref:DUF1127 domain-containing protein n=1 Tax=Primorskyibacter aestuariivivens TaxID=1888912 RepID=UPI002301E838|nr:DUF1127 domain-containing protein [Primorskyibacter aestuariivivens]MDA7427003.1 DUF1127 domain-containing protein [Primorskyibacter aestuariivivens]
MAHMISPQAQALAYLANRPLTPFSSAALKIVVTLVKWEHMRRTRNSLQHLDDHLLDDIGVTREMADHEAARPFWQA